MKKHCLITCAVTHTPISGGQPIRILIGVKKTNKNLRVRSEDTFHPFGYFLQGFYSSREDGTVDIIKAGHFRADVTDKKTYQLSHEALTDEQRYLRALAVHHATMTGGKRKNYNLSFERLLPLFNQEYEYVTVPATEHSGEISYLAVHEYVFHDIVHQIMWRKPKSHVYQQTAMHEAISNLNQKLRTSDATERQEKLRTARKTFLDKNQISEDSADYEHYLAAFERVEGSRFMLQTIQEETNFTDILGLNDILSNKFEVDDVVADVLETLAFIQFMNRHNLPLLPTKESVPVSSKGFVSLCHQQLRWAEVAFEQECR
ncbi:hypothetical protein EA58_14200 [Photobacterium galatheae]|uniref:Uncharacterized protein n=1 Tax=Photobacterium galatheae TaxID=1654360 RepID=A0A066RT82_9GAMM|nr:hypothetical protein EA58_14200 [Photobacterium galatheae]